MKLINKKREISCICAVGFFVLCTVLTGCTGRKAGFLKLAEADFRNSEAELMQEYDAEADLEEAEAQKKRAENRDTETAEEPVDDRNSEGAEAVTEVPQPPAEIFVDVCGAVVCPGVYRMVEGSRVFQAIEAAGGYLPEADGDYINRAGFLADGQQIYVPTETETEEAGFAGKTDTGQPDVQGGTFQNVQESADSGGKVNLNTADEAGLMTLTGIGAARAQAIISYREENGPFTSVEEIMNVQGIKEGTFTKIKDDIEVG